MISNFFNLSLGAHTFNWMTIIGSIVLAFVLSLLVAVVYKNTHRGLSYSQSFTTALVFIGTLVAVIIMVIGNSLAAAFGAFGVFSMVRFRTAIKDAKDVVFILMVVAIGLSVGTMNYFIAVVATLFAVAAVYALAKVNFGSIRKYDFVLTFVAETGSFSNEKMREIFNQYLKSDNLLSVTAKEGGRFIDYSFNVRFIKNDEMQKFITAFNQMPGVGSVEVISAKNDIEY